MIENLTNFGIIQTQMLALVFIEVVHEAAVFKKWWLETRGPPTTIKSANPAASTTSIASIKAKQIAIRMKGKHVILLVKKGIESLPTKKEILYSPMIRTNYTMLLNPPTSILSY